MVSIIVPVLNQHAMTKECLESVKANTKEYELIIIDNGSEPPIENATIRNEENLGFPVAINQGIRGAKGDIIVLLNNDVIVTSEWADRLIAWLDKYNIVAPCTNFCTGYQSVDIGIYEDIEELNIEAGKWSEENKDIAEDVNWVIGFCVMFKKSLYDEIGKFDETLWPCCGEEIDFCMRAREAGKKVGIARDVYVHHHGSITFQDIHNEHSYPEIIKKNIEHLSAKWGDIPQSEQGRSYSGR